MSLNPVGQLGPTIVVERHHAVDPGRRAARVDLGDPAHAQQSVAA
jgi:hypothetical protein